MHSKVIAKLDPVVELLQADPALVLPNGFLGLARKQIDNPPQLLHGFLVETIVLFEIHVGIGYVVKMVQVFRQGRLDDEALATLHALIGRRLLPVGLDVLVEHGPFAARVTAVFALVGAVEGRRVFHLQIYRGRFATQAVRTLPLFPLLASG